MSTIRAADGGYLLNANHFNYTSDEQGRPVLNVKAGAEGDGDFMADGSVEMTGNLQMGGQAIIGVKSISNTDSGMAIESEVSLNNHRITDLLDPTDEQDAVTKKYVDDRTVLGGDGKAIGDVDMNEHAIINAHKVSTDGVAPLYIGATIEPSGTDSPRLTATTAGEAAFVKADTQSAYIPVNVGAPTTTSHATTKEYVDGKVGAIQASAILKSGGKMVGKLILRGVPTEANEAATKDYVDMLLPDFTETDNGKVLGIVGGNLAWVDKT